LTLGLKKLSQENSNGPLECGLYAVEAWLKDLSASVLLGKFYL